MRYMIQFYMWGTLLGGVIFVCLGVWHFLVLQSDDPNVIGAFFVGSFFIVVGVLLRALLIFVKKRPSK